MKLFLFTNYFPFKRSEPFLVNEFNYAKQKFSNITVLSLYGKSGDPLSVADGAGTEFLQPIFSKGSGKEILLKGIFNFSPISEHVREFFAQGLFFRFSKLYWFLVSLLIVRAVMASDSYRKIIRDIEQQSSALLYFYWGDNQVWIIPYIKKRFGNKVKIVIRMHGSDLYEELKANYAPLRTRILQDSDHIFTVSDFGAHYLRNKYPQVASKVSVARLGVEDHGLNPQNESDVFRIVSVSNLVPLKRVHLIVEALMHINFQVDWHHFGDGPLLNELKNKASKLPKNIRVTFHGNVPNKQLMEYYKSHCVNLLMNVSSSEGVPVSIMEAFSFGIPVMATNVGGTSELVNDSNGFLLAKELSSQDLLVAINKWFEINPQKINDFKKSARITFEKLSSAEMNYTAFYDQLVK